MCVEIALGIRFDSVNIVFIYVPTSHGINTTFAQTLLKLCA